ncbi:MAG: universal stress protein [Raineya sp.]|jgi:nucleotide-binding universal stress UspA family protein|nr:universal stress protein [Raineya sp.]
MDNMYKKIALAIGLNPRTEALVCEAKRIQKVFQAELLLIHVGEQTPEREQLMSEFLQNSQAKDLPLKWIDKSSVTENIIKTCESESVDLLIIGAFARETFLKRQIGSVSRALARKANCSLLILTDPSKDPKPFRKIVVDGNDPSKALETISVALTWEKIEDATQVHILKEANMLGLSIMASEDRSEDEIATLKRDAVKHTIDELERLIQPIISPDSKINIKIISGKFGYEIARFSSRILADLLIVPAPERSLGILDRIFTHDLEHILADLPTNVLIAY